MINSKKSILTPNLHLKIITTNQHYHHSSHIQLHKLKIVSSIFSYWLRTVYRFYFNFNQDDVIRKFRRLNCTLDALANAMGKSYTY